MESILHIGAHRTGTTSFQAYLRRHSPDLQGMGIACWGPWSTRDGLFDGIQPMQGLRGNALRRARGRILLRKEHAKWEFGAHTLLVSEENMIGAVGRNLRLGTFYDDVGERMARYAAAFDGRIDQVSLCIRGLDMYWASAAAYAVNRGHPAPSSSKWANIAAKRRSWRDVITDIACAVPDIRLTVLPFERYMGRPNVQLSSILGRTAPPDTHPAWLHRSPDLAAIQAILTERGESPQSYAIDTRWIPFAPEIRAAFQEQMADDMHWLIAGADGMATLTEEIHPSEMGKIPPSGLQTRGQSHDIKERRLADHR